MFITKLYISDNNVMPTLLDSVEVQRNEKLAINAIQESLMQIETAVNPTSSNITMPGTPPAYSTAVSYVNRLLNKIPWQTK